MRFKQVAGSQGFGDRFMAAAYNAETVSINRGTPLVLALNGTGDGWQVVLPSTAGAAKTNAFLYGIASETMAPASRQDVALFGYVPYALVSIASRSASSASWSVSASAAGVGIVLIADAVNNCFASGAASVVTNGNPFAVLVDNIPAVAASASNTSDTRTALLVGLRVFARML